MVTGELTSSLHVTPTPSTKEISNTIINSSPSSTQFEAPTNLNIKIIVASVLGVVVLLVGVTIALMMAMLSSRSCHRSHENELHVRMTDDKYDQLQHKVMKTSKPDQPRNYENVYVKVIKFSDKII